MEYKIIDFDEKYLGKEGVKLVHIRHGKESEIISVKNSEMGGLQVCSFDDYHGFHYRDIGACRFYCKMKIPIKKNPFSIEAWETGNYDVVTRGGEKVTEIAVYKDPLSKDYNFVVAAVVAHNWGRFLKNGRYFNDICDHNFDLFLVEKEYKNERI